MRRIILLAILCTVTVSLSFSQDFRKSSWGDSMEKVKAAEGNKEWEDVQTDEDFQTAIASEGNIGGLEAWIVFYFVEDKLFAGSYMFSEEHSDDNSFISDFDFIDENLQEKYGSKKVERDWTVDTWKDSRDYWGFALKQGELSIYTEWEVSDEDNVTEIYHVIFGEDYNVVHKISYYSVELAAYLDNLKKEENVF